MVHHFWIGRNSYLFTSHVVNIKVAEETQFKAKDLTFTSHVVNIKGNDKAYEW